MYLRTIQKRASKAKPKGHIFLYKHSLLYFGVFKEICVTSTICQGVTIYQDEATPKRETFYSSNLYSPKLVLLALKINVYSQRCENARFSEVEKGKACLYWCKSEKSTSLPDRFAENPI